MERGVRNGVLSDGGGTRRTCCANRSQLSYLLNTLDVFFSFSFVAWICCAPRRGESWEQDIKSSISLKPSPLSPCDCIPWVSYVVNAACHPDAPLPHISTQLRPLCSSHGLLALHMLFCLSVLSLAFALRLCRLLGLLGHDVLELRPQRLDRGELVADLCHAPLSASYPRHRREKHDVRW